MTSAEGTAPKNLFSGFGGFGAKKDETPKADEKKDGTAAASTEKPGKWTNRWLIRKTN